MPRSFVVRSSIPGFGGLPPIRANQSIIASPQVSQQEESGDEDMTIATLELNNAQIKNVNTPYVIVPATETLEYEGAPTQMPFPIAVLISVDTGGGGYSGIDATASWRVVLGSDWSVDLMRSGDLPDMTGAHACIIYVPLLTKSSVNPASPADPHYHNLTNFMNNVNLDGNVQDNALAIVLANGDDLTDGHASNGAKITVIYQMVDL